MRSSTTFETETFKRNKLEPGLTHGQWVKNLPAVQETQETWFDPWVWQIPWRKKWQPTPVFRQRSLVGYSPKGHIELDTTKQLSTHTRLGP